MADIYVRTELGSQELDDPRTPLGIWSKHVLRMLDGRRDIAAICRTCPQGVGESAIRSLVEQGFAQLSGMPDGVNHGNASTGEADAGRLPRAPIPAGDPESVVVPMGLRSLSRRSSTTALHTLGPARLQEAKLALANSLLDHAGAAADSLATRMAKSTTASELAALIPEAEANAARVGRPQLKAFQAVVRDLGLPTTAA